MADVKKCDSCGELITVEETQVSAVILERTIEEQRQLAEAGMGGCDSTLKKSSDLCKKCANKLKALIFPELVGGIKKEDK